jgi:hypothetical protein
MFGQLFSKVRRGRGRGAGRSPYLWAACGGSASGFASWSSVLAAVEEGPLAPRGPAAGGLACSAPALRTRRRRRRRRKRWIWRERERASSSPKGCEHPTPPLGGCSQPVVLQGPISQTLEPMGTHGPPSDAEKRFACTNRRLLRRAIATGSSRSSWSWRDRAWRPWSSSSRRPSRSTAKARPGSVRQMAEEEPVLYPALWKAAYQGGAEKVRQLLATGADIEEPGGGPSRFLAGAWGRFSQGLEPRSGPHTQRTQECLPSGV